MEELEEFNVATAPKTGTFQMRINPKIKERVENIYAASGMTLTDAINTFIQQSINVEGLPFIVTKNSKEALRQQDRMNNTAVTIIGDGVPPIRPTAHSAITLPAPVLLIALDTGIIPANRKMVTQSMEA